MVGPAFQFDGASGLVIVPDSPSLAPTAAITVEAWVRPADPQALFGPIVKRAGGEQDSGYALEFHVPPLASLWLNIVGTHWTHGGTGPLHSNQWTHIAGTYDSACQTLYINGALNSQNCSTSGPINQPIGELHLGHDPSNASRYYNGIADEVAIYNRGLSASEVQAIFAAGSAGKCKPNSSPVSSTRVWIGLANSDDVGIRFDLRAEVYKNAAEPIAAGELTGVAGGSSGFNNANEHNIDLIGVPGAAINSGDTLSFVLYARNACSGSRKNSGRARLWYNDAAADSRFFANVGSSTTQYLLDGFTFGGAPGTGPKKTRDVAAGPKCSPFKPFGTWSAVVP
jgi:hypothetical protein